MRCKLALMPMIRKPSINPGEKIEVEIFIAGHGVPKQNKLQITYSSPRLIDQENPGVMQACVSTAKTRIGRPITAPKPGS